MAEYIGARISLVSKSDIRYLGTLHEINSENSTVALENVTSMGTEGRRNGINEMPPSDNNYEYIVFRGSDVKDLRIEEPAKEKAPPPEHVPDDPAILGSTRPPQAGFPSQPPQQQLPFNKPPPYGQFPPYNPIHNQGFGCGGFPPVPGGPGFPGGSGLSGQQFGPPPGWYPPPGQGFPPGPGSFSPHHQQGSHGPPGPPSVPGQQPPQQQNRGLQSVKGSQQAPIGQGAPKETKPEEMKLELAASKAPEPVAAPKKAPTPPVESKPDVTAAIAPPAATTAPASNTLGGSKGRVAPVIPRQVLTAKPADAQSSAAQTPTSAQTYQNATQAATAAVAAAMAKLPMAGKSQAGQTTPFGGDAAVDNLTKKVQEMRTDNNIRHSAQPGTGGYVAGNRGGRGGGHRGGRRDHPASKPVEVPTTDYDFAGANAKFNKQDLVKKAIAARSPLGTPDAPEISSPMNGAANGKTEEKASEEVVIPPAQQAYDKKSSFFDNISSELKDRDESKRGMEFRSEERKKNMETFGQGSVDSYRGGYRGRGRGRGGHRGRGRGYANAGSGYPARGRGGVSGEGQ